MPTLRPRQSLGQNFLVDPNTCRRIVESLRAGPDDPVVEIGPGKGAITALLLKRHPSMIAFEIDERAIEILRRELPALDVRHQDAVAIDWPSISAESDARLFVIGNLPYHITSPILFSLLEHANCFEEAILMMQLEVAQRLVAVPCTKSYGILSVATQLVARPEILFRVSPNVFRPRPKVTSAVMRLDFPGEPARQLFTGTLRDVVRSAFNQRRKKLRNSLKRIAEPLGVELPERWSGRRAEELSPQEFIELARYLTPAS